VERGLKIEDTDLVGKDPLLSPAPNRANRFLSPIVLPIWYTCPVMPAYCTKRSELFAIAVFLGGAVSAIAFRYHADQISSYFDLRILHAYLNILLVLAYLLPPLVFYAGLYSLNGLLVRLFGKIELNERKKTILKTLFEAISSGQTLSANPVDLLEEVAWISLKKYWRPE